MAGLECRIPISPSPSWFNKVRLIVASIREFYPDSIFRVSVGGWPDPDNFQEMATAYRTIEGASFPEISGVTWADVPREEFFQWKGTRYPHLATVLDKFKPPFIGDHILMLDADVICMRDFDELFERGERLCGVMAHVPPIHIDQWHELFMRMGIPTPKLDKEYSGWGTMNHDLSNRFGPSYFNSGVVFGPRSIFEKLHQPYMNAIAGLRMLLADNYWFDQLGIALGIADARLDVSVLPLRYNFPNQQSFDERHPHELADARFIHYLRTDTIDRDKDLESREAMERLACRDDLTGSNERFRVRLSELLARLT